MMTTNDDTETTGLTAGGRIAFVTAIASGFAAALLAATPASGQHLHAEHLSAETLATGLVDGYQIVVTDLNRDGRPDLLPVASGLTELVWLENPRWTRHVVTKGLLRPENVAAHDLDGDGVPELGLVSGFSQSPSRSTGRVTILTHAGDPRQPWSAAEIDRLPTSHRTRWVDIDGRGQVVLVNAPLVGQGAEPPDQRAANPLVYYRPGTWQREVIGYSEGLVHGLYAADLSGSGVASILTAGFAGVEVYRLQAGQWTRTELLAGSPRGWPRSGASEVGEVWLGGSRVFATVEPWHGNELVVHEYRGGRWQRHVVDAHLGLGHGVLGVDLDGTGEEVLVVADRGDTTRGVYLYTYRARGATRWRKEVLDSEMQASGCAAADIDGDERMDLVCIGRATEELVWFRNTRH